jgi:hypothetical protein
MSKHEGWLRRIEIVVAVGAALVIGLAWVAARLFDV